jgi:beta-phosphoglucomutase-like phosphatase (HAD superfamily)
LLYGQQQVSFFLFQDLDIFLKAAEKLGLQPEECVVFEDAVNGVKGAKAAGMKCIALKTTTPELRLRESGADYVVNSYNEVRSEMIK